MNAILERIAETYSGRFAPSNPEEFFALTLARRLGEPEAAQHYALLLAQHSQEALLSAFRRAQTRAGTGQPLSRDFHNFVGGRAARTKEIDPIRLLALRVERRCVAAAVLHGTHLEGVRGRHLRPNLIKAEASTADFIGLLLEDFQVEAVAVERAPESDEIHRALIHRTIIGLMISGGLPIWQFDHKDVRAGFGYPEPRSRKQVRNLVQSIWPMLGVKDSRTSISALDALALGLYAQTERLFLYP